MPLTASESHSTEKVTTIKSSDIIKDILSENVICPKYGGGASIPPSTCEARLKVARKEEGKVYFGKGGFLDCLDCPKAEEHLKMAKKGKRRRKKCLTCGEIKDLSKFKYTTRPLCNDCFDNKPSEPPGGPKVVTTPKKKAAKTSEFSHKTLESPTITIKLPPEIATGLQEVADVEYRTPEMQAAWIIREYITFMVDVDGIKKSGRK